MLLNKNLKFEHIHCGKWEGQSKITNKMADSEDPDVMAGSGSALFEKVSVLVCRDENVKTCQ